MKCIKSTIIVLLLLLSIKSYGRGIFVHPRIGAGVGDNYYPRWDGDVHSGKAAFSIGTSAGYNFGGLRIGTGAHFLSTGYRMYGAIFALPGEHDNIDIWDINVSYRQLFIPFTIGYTIKPTAKFSITPEFSYGPTFNLMNRKLTESLTTNRRMWGQSDGGGAMLYAMGSLYAGYHLNKHVAVTLSINYWHEANGLFGPSPEGKFLPQGLNSIMGNAGLLLDL